MWFVLLNKDAEEIEAYDEKVDHQFGILFTFKKDLSNEERQALERVNKIYDFKTNFI